MESVLPALNATLNGTSAILLLVGYRVITQRRVGAHAVYMSAACVVSTLFVLSYVTYHVQVGSVRFLGQGWIRPVYFTILATHTALAIVIVPLVLRTLFLAVRRRFTEHERWARWTLPLWLYVSVTGVVVYWMLYRIHWT